VDRFVRKPIIRKQSMQLLVACRMLRFR